MRVIILLGFLLLVLSLLFTADAKKQKKRKNGYKGYYKPKGGLESVLKKANDINKAHRRAERSAKNRPNRRGKQRR